MHACQRLYMEAEVRGLQAEDPQLSLREEQVGQELPCSAPWDSGCSGPDWEEALADHRDDLGQGWAHLPCEGQDSKWAWLSQPCGLCHGYAALPLKHRSSPAHLYVTGVYVLQGNWLWTLRFHFIPFSCAMKYYLLIFFNCLTYKHHSQLLGAQEVLVGRILACGSMVCWRHTQKLKGGQIFIWNTFCDPVAKSCLTLCNPMDCSTPGFHVLHYLPECAQTHVRWVGDALHTYWLHLCSLHCILPPTQPRAEIPLCLGPLADCLQWVMTLHC